MGRKKNYAAPYISHIYIKYRTCKQFSTELASFSWIIYESLKALYTDIRSMVSFHIIEFRVRSFIYLSPDLPNVCYYSDLILEAVFKRIMFIRVMNNLFL